MKRIFLFSAVMLFAVACQKSDDAQQETPNYEESEFEKEPVEDQMEVITNRKTVLYGDETEGFGASLIRRFRNISGIYDESTKVCIVTNSAIVSGALTRTDYLNIYDCYRRGGIVIVTSPTHQGFSKVFQPEMAEAVNSRNITSFNMKVNGHAPMSNGTDTFLSQIQIPDNGGQPWDGLGFSIKGILYCEDLDGNDQAGEEAATPYQIGLRADAAVRWMERSLVAYGSQMDDEIEKAKTTVTYMHSMSKHYPSTSGKDINDLFSPTFEAKDAFIEDITYVVAHDTDAHTDFYLISQNAEFRSNLFSPVPRPNNNTYWWNKKEVTVNDTCHAIQYVHSFYNWKSTLSMSMSGKSVRIKNSSPEADNSTTTTTTTVTDGTMESETVGISIGGSLGGSPAGISGMVSSSISHSWTTGTTHTVAVGIARSKKDISILKSASDNKVTWTYSGKPLNWYFNEGDRGYICWDMGDLQLSSMTQTNSFLAEIKDVTSGAATLTIDNEVTVRSGCYYKREMKPTENKLFIVDCPTKYSTTKIELPTPYRYSQTWMLNCVAYGDMESTTDKTNLWNDVEKNMLNGSSKYKMGDFTADGTIVAEAVMSLLLQDFASRVDHYKATYGAIGKFIFEFRRSDTPGQVITAEYTIK